MDRVVLHLLLMSCLVFHMGKSYRFSNHIRRTLPQLHRAMVAAPEGISISAEDQLIALINRCIELDKENDSAAMMRSVSAELMESAYLFAKGDLYDRVMDTRANDCASAAENTRLTHVDSFLRGIIQSEKRARARLKVNYILAGAASNRIDEAVAMLQSTDEIDDDLFFCIDGLIQKELVACLGPTASLEGDVPDLRGAGKETIEVLRMVQRRLKAEVQTAKRPHVRLLALMVHETDAATRDGMLRKHLSRIEDIEDFHTFVEGAVNFLLSDRRGSGESDSGREIIDVFPENVNVEIMKDIAVSTKGYLAKLQTGLKDGDVFSTQDEDYLDGTDGAPDHENGP